jgi:DNA-binding NarL/FixJ family response regulator
VTTRGLRVVVATPFRLKGEILTDALIADGPFEAWTATADADGLVHEVAGSRPDVVLLDMGFEPERDAVLGICTRVAEASTPTGCLGLMDDPTVADVRELVGAGGAGIFDSTTSLGQLVRAVEVVAAGGRWMAPSTTEGAADRASPADTDPEGRNEAPLPLTPREHEVLRLLSEGHDHVEIANRLSLSPHTARTHIRNLLRKLGVHTRLDAVLAAMDRGLVDREGV